MDLSVVEFSCGQQSLFAAAGSLTTMLIGFWLGRIHAERTERFKERLAARKDFRTALNVAIADLPQPDQLWAGHLLQLDSLRRVVNVAVKNYLFVLKPEEQVTLSTAGIKCDAYAGQLLKYYGNPVGQLSHILPDDIRGLQKDLLSELQKLLLRYAGQWVL